MSATNHPEIQDGEVLFCYATAGQFLAFGEELKRILRKGRLVLDDCHPIKGTAAKDYLPYFAKVSELSDVQRQWLGIAERPQSLLAEMRNVEAFREFTGTSGFIHTSKGPIDLSDRRSRGYYA